MKFFSKVQTFPVMIAGFLGKNIPAGPGNKKPGVVIKARVPLTKEQLREMPPIVQTILSVGAEKIQEALMLGKCAGDFSTRISLRIFQPGSSEMLIERGFAHGNPMVLKVKNFYHIGDLPIMEIELTGRFDHDTWTWGGATIAQPDWLFEVQPFEGELFPEEEADAHENGKDSQN